MRRHFRILGLALILGLAGAGWWWANRPPQRPDILLVSIDTMRADTVSWLADPARPWSIASITPTIDALYSEAARIPFGLTPTPLTLPAHTSLFSGLFPDNHAVRENDSFVVPPRAERGYSLLAEDLRAAGYRTAGFVSGQPLERRSGLASGFETWDQPNPDRQIQDAMAFRERSARDTTDRALNWIRGLSDEPAFLFVHYFDPHQPYERHPGDQDLGDDPRGRYAAEVRRVDAQLARLLEAFRSRSRPQVILVTSDHGEALGDEGELTHGLLLQESTLRVPFVLVPPTGVDPRAFAGGPARLVDVYPTLMDLCGIPGGTWGGRDGESLRGRTGPWHHSAETLYGYYQYRTARLRAWYTRDRKLVEGGGKNSVVRWQEPDLAKDESPEVARDLERDLFRFLSRPRVGKSGSVAVVPDAANPYLGGRPGGLPVEPTEEENRSLPRIEEQWDVVMALEDARSFIRAGDPAAAEAHLRPGLERLPDHPALLFWTARASDLLGREPRLTPEARLLQWQRAESLYRRHFEKHGDGRSLDALLKIHLQRYELTKEASHLDRLFRAAEVEIRSGQARALTFVFRAQAFEARGDIPSALADFEAAAALDRDDPRLLQDLSRLRGRLDRGR